MSALQELRALLTEYLGSRKGAHDITDAVLGLILAEIQEHAENAPHLHPDGSS